MARVFISHAGEDLAQAKQLRDWLVEDRHEVFLDRDLRTGILVGEEWAERLHERLRWADAVVCVITTAYVDSVWCTAEVGAALSRGSRLVPIRAEPRVKHPLLKHLQYRDMTRDPDAARTALSEALQEVDQLHGLGWADDRSPFPGLRPFDTDMHRVFFGRDADVQQLARRLRSPADRASNAVLLVVGPSGCGKSSLIRAGLIPTIAFEPDWWTLPAFTPGLDPISALVRELAAAAKAINLDWPIDEIKDRVARGEVVSLVDTLLLAAPGSRRKRLLVAVDQFEELLVQTPSAQLISFASVLRALLTGPVQVVATVRPEFLDRILSHPELSTLSLPIHPLRPLRREMLRTVIEGPARHAGLTVSDELVSLLVDDTDNGDALPLLAFTLEQLADGVSRGGELSRSHYDQLGGVRGALIHQADTALADAVNTTGRDQDTVLDTLLRLVTVDEQNRPTRLHVKRADLPEAEAAELDAFVAHRLLTVDTVDGDTVLSASHEAFFTQWPPLDATIQDRAAALRARRLVEDAATEWDTSSRPREKLWERGQLASALNAMDVDICHRQAHVGRVHVSALGREFLHRSVRHDRFRRRALVVTLSVLLVLALTATGGAVALWQVAQEQTRMATAQLLIDKAEEALATDPRTALMLSVAAYRIHPDADTYATVLRMVMTTPYAGELRGGVDASVTSVSYGRNGLLAVGFDSGAVVLWDVSDPLRAHMLGKPLTSFQASASTAFSADGTRLVTAGSNGAVTIWDLTDPEHPRTMGTPLPGIKADWPGDAELARDAWLAPDGTTLITSEMVTSISDNYSAVDVASVVRLWDLTDPTQVRPLAAPLINLPAAIGALAFSPDSTMIATLSSDFPPEPGLSAPVALWDISQRTSARLLGTFTPNFSDVASLSFSPDSKQLAIGAHSGVELWDVTDPTKPRPPPPDLADVDVGSEVYFSPHDATLVTAGGQDDELLVWDVTDPHSPKRIDQLLAGHRQDHVAFSPDGTIVASGNDDGVVTLWNLRREGRPKAWTEPTVGPTAPTGTSIFSFAITDDATILGVGRVNSTVELWDIADPAKPRQLSTLTEHVDLPENGAEIAFSPSGNLMATSGADNQTVLWDLHNPARPRKLGHLVGYDESPTTIRRNESAITIVFSPDGTTLTMIRYYRTTVWDIRDPEHPRRRATVFDNEYVMEIWHTRDGRVLALGNRRPGSGEPTGSRLWDITDPARPRQLTSGLTGHRHAEVASAAMSPDETLLAVSDKTGAVIIWDISDPTKPRRIGDPLTPYRLDPNFGIAFPPQSGIMATQGLRGDVDLWDIGNPALPRQLMDGPSMSTYTLLGPNPRFSRDGMILATTAPGDNVALWDLTDFHELRRDPAGTACAITDRGLNREEWTLNVPSLPYQSTCS